MKRELVLRRWAALAHVLLLLCHSPTLSMALSVHQSRHLRLARYAFRHPTPASAVEALTFSSVSSSSLTSPRRKGLRRARAATMLHSDAYAGSTSTSAHVQLSPLPTAMDRVLPFGRCVGVALPAAMTDDVMRAAEEELLPEEMSYCAALPKTLQVSGAEGKTKLGNRREGAKRSVVEVSVPSFFIVRLLDNDSVTSYWLRRLFDRASKQRLPRSIHTCEHVPPTP